MTRKTVLIIDDEPDIRELLEITLIRMGLDTQSASDVREAKALLAEQDFELVLTDMNLPDGNGIELVAYIQAQFPSVPVAMITAYGSVETAINALKAGAFDFISKPVDLTQLRDIVASALKLSEQNDASKQINSPQSSALILGDTPAVHALNKQIAKLARSQAPIYISGESGSGKELVARSIHQLGPRSTQPFVAVNCGAIPSELMESEFFGHRKGSFSGAHEDKEGLFVAAHGGTLFLDEVADLPLAMQVKLLRAIQEKAVRAVGAQSEQNVDVRVLSATHKNLENMVDQGLFRQDLFYRINVIKLDVPSLRSRKEDIPLLAQHFLAKLSLSLQLDSATFAPDALQALANYAFPGNVRELENIIERAFTLCEHNLIQVEDLHLKSQGQATLAEPTTNPSLELNPADNLLANSPTPQTVQPAATNVAEQGRMQGFPKRPEGMGLEDFLEAIERAELEAALAATKWNRTAAAKMLGLSFRSLRYRLKKLEMD